jgi:carboxymethylenebutenolidase
MSWRVSMRTISSRNALPTSKLTSISRTVGADRLVNEMLVSFTHDVEIDWMHPGVPPTGSHVEVPTVAIVNSHGEHIY